jgi:hypothetical protein
MTHDPMCPWAQDGGFDIRGECFLIEGSEPPISACELVAKVRADEKAKWTHTCPDNNCCNGGPN